MIRISPIIKKTTIAPLYASAVLGLSSCVAAPHAQPDVKPIEKNVTQETPKTMDFDLTDVFNKYKSNLLGLGLIAFGLGLGKSIVSKAKKTQALKREEKENFRENCLKVVDDYYLKCKYHSQMDSNDLKKQLYEFLQKPYFVRMGAKEELTLFLKNYNQITLMELPLLKYLVDKSTSSQEEWEYNQKKYPALEFFLTDHSVYDKHTQVCLDLTDKILEYKVTYNSHKILNASMDALKKELFAYGVCDVNAFDDAVACLDAAEALQHFNLNVERNMFAKLKTNVLRALGEAIDIEDDEEEDLSSEWQSGPIKNSEPQSNGTSFFQSHNDSKKISFKDIGGQREVLKQLSKKILFPIRYPEAFKSKEISHGIILYGPPGTGKTLMALALANEADVPFYKLNGLELIDSYVGSSEKNFRNLFAKAKKEAPCIIFLDEFDAIARARSGDKQGRHDDKIVNQLLTLLSDIEKEGQNIFVITATNRLDILDPALLRSGRLGTHIEVGLPDTPEAIEQIFNIHTKSKPISKDFKKTEFINKLLKNKVSGADIASIINEALENAYERSGIYKKMERKTFTNNDLKKLEITNEDFDKAITFIKKENINARPQIGFNKS